MAGLNCDLCGGVVRDGDGKVVVDRARFEGPDSSVDHLQLACNECFARLADRLHRMWELAWLKEHFLWVNQGVLEDLAAEAPARQWSAEAVRKFIRLGSLVLPEQSREPSKA